MKGVNVNYALEYIVTMYIFMIRFNIFFLQGLYEMTFTALNLHVVLLRINQFLEETVANSEVLSCQKKSEVD